jgi:hypothetical protein
MEDECGDEESDKDFNDTIAEVFAIVYPSFANSRSPRTERTVPAFAKAAAGKRVKLP